MLLYTRRAAPKEPKKRSRAGCQHCKQKKKKCDEKRPRCQRCIDYGADCDYTIREIRRRTNTEEEVGEKEQPHSQEYDESFASPILSQDIFEDDLSADQSSNTMVRSNRYPDLAMIAPSPVGSPLLDFYSPVFYEFSENPNRRALVGHFCNVLSQLIVLKEDSTNPFRQLILPLAHSSPAISNAIFALSSAHLEYRGTPMAESSLTFHNKALQHLASLIDTNEPSNMEQVLGAIMLLVYYEVLVQRGNSSIVQGHLKGAKAIMKSSTRNLTPTSLFLKQAFCFYDVITALSLGCPPSSVTPTYPASSYAHASSAKEAGKFSLSHIDPLLGLSTDLWPLMHRLSSLLPMKIALQNLVDQNLVTEASALRVELETTSDAIEIALKSWIPVFPTRAGVEGDWLDTRAEAARIQSIMSNAEAYRHSSLVYLYRTIRDLPRDNTRVQKCVYSSLEACSDVVTNAQTCSEVPTAALLWPLFVAACEAYTERDRSLSRQIFFEIERKQGMRNIMHAWEVIQELWERIDGGETEVDWRSISGAKGYNLVFG